VHLTVTAVAVSWLCEGTHHSEHIYRSTAHTNHPPNTSHTVSTSCCTSGAGTRHTAGSGQQHVTTLPCSTKEFSHTCLGMLHNATPHQAVPAADASASATQAQHHKLLVYNAMCRIHPCLQKPFHLLIQNTRQPKFFQSTSTWVDSLNC
jgi:hypothetical protein